MGSGFSGVLSNNLLDVGGLSRQFLKDIDAVIAVISSCLMLKRNSSSQCLSIPVWDIVNPELARLYHLVSDCLHHALSMVNVL